MPLPIHCRVFFVPRRLCVLDLEPDLFRPDRLRYLPGAACTASQPTARSARLVVCAELWLQHRLAVRVALRTGRAISGGDGRAAPDADRLL